MTCISKSMISEDGGSIPLLLKFFHTNHYGSTYKNGTGTQHRLHIYENHVESLISQVYTVPYNEHAETVDHGENTGEGKYKLYCQPYDRL